MFNKAMEAATSWEVWMRPNGNVSLPPLVYVSHADLTTVFRAAHDGSNAVKKWFESTSRM